LNGQDVTDRLQADAEEHLWTLREPASGRLAVVAIDGHGNETRINRRVKLMTRQSAPRPEAMRGDPELASVK
jgi:hypothetical protein